MFKKIAIILIVIALMSVLTLSVSATTSNGNSIFSSCTNGQGTYYSIDVTKDFSTRLSTGTTSITYDVYYADAANASTWWFLPFPETVAKGQNMLVSGYFYTDTATLRLMIRDNSGGNQLINMPYSMIGTDSLGTKWYRYDFYYEYTIATTGTNFYVAIVSNENVLNVGNVTCSLDDTYLLINSINTGVNAILDRSDSNATWVRDQIVANANENSQNEMDNADKNASDIQDNADANTDKQIEADKQLQEDEKKEASSGGNANVGDVTGAMPDASSGFLSGIQQLANAMSYTGTDCVWKLPSISLPAIPGVMDSIKLTDELDINLTQFVSAIPSGILSIVRALFDIVLIVFCAKELYGLIQQIMTARGGGSSE